MPRRKVPLVKGELYHIVNKSIADFKIFNNNNDYERMMREFIFYNMEKTLCEKYYLLNRSKKISILNEYFIANYSKRLVDIIAYCLMPTHIHLILEELRDGGITKFITSILKSYSQYFNLKHRRKGPLWEGRFTNVLIENDYQFTHVTRYIHLNPVTAHLADVPEDWKYSSHKEYIGLVEQGKRLCSFSDYLDMNIENYKEFVRDQIGYQRELASIKHLTLE